MAIFGPSCTFVLQNTRKLLDLRFSQWISPGWVKTKKNRFSTNENRWSRSPDPLKSRIRPFLEKFKKKLVFLRLIPNILESISYYFIKFCWKDPNFIIKQNIFFVICVKNGLNLDFVDQDFLTTDFHSSKSYFFLVSTHPGLIHCEKPKIQQFNGVL
jgi:hypothetical protein